MSSIELEQLDNSIKQAKQLIELGDALNRLRGNRDFKKIVLEGYFENEAIRLVHLRSDPNMQSADRQKAINVQLDSVGTFAQYLQTIAIQAAMASRGLDADEQTRAELIEEGA